MAIEKRNLQHSRDTLDPAAIDNFTYNNASGARKVTEVGKRLLPLGNGSAGFTTDASTARALPSAGRNLAVYNKDTSVHSVSLGTSGGVTAQSIGGCSTDGTSVGIPVAPGTWLSIACGHQTWVITDSSSLVVFLVEDASYITVQSQNNAST